MSSLNVTRWKLGEDIDGPALSAFVALECVVSSPLNLFILIYTLVYGRNDAMKSSTIFLFCLALSNLLMSLLYMPFVVIASGAKEWIFGATDQIRYYFCQFHGFIFIYSVSVSAHVLTVISIDRFLSILKPSIHQKFMTLKLSVGIMIVIWVIDIIMNLTPYYGSGLGQYDWGMSVGGCIPIWVGHRDYLISTCCLSLIPLTIILVTSVWTFIFTRGFFRRNLRRHKQNLNAESLEVQKHIYSVRVKYLIGIFGTLILFHILIWLPFLCTSIIGLFIGLDNVPRKVYGSVFVIFLFSNVTNPFIQTYFRKDILKFLKKSLHRVTVSCSKNGDIDSFQRNSSMRNGRTNSDVNRNNEVQANRTEGLAQTEAADFEGQNAIDSLTGTEVSNTTITV